ncbi:MAG TPA: hypothetical protein VJN01_04780 [Xanthomonadales bacterium]|nr:hypothetical protein [Xanthomonadales bacterium]
MNSKLFFVATAVSAVLYVNPVLAHQPGYYGGSQGGVSGSISIWSGAPYGPGYSGTINYGRVYAPAPPYYGAYWYPTCGHWHPRAYRAPKHHAYANGYAHGYYADSYYNDRHHGKKSHKNRGKKHHYYRDRDHDDD